MAKAKVRAQKITTFLWFDDEAEKAAKFYISLFPNSRIEHVARYVSNDAPGSKKGAVMTVTFTLAGQRFTALNGGPMFEFTPAISLQVDCKDQKEVDRLWRAILKRGGKESQCGWITDAWGLSWQIVPRELPALVQHPAALKAMLKMRKIDLATLRKAAKAA